MDRVQSVTLAPDIIEKRHAETLRERLRGEVRTDRHNRMLYATDASIYQTEPLAVVIPADTADTLEAIRYCHEHGLPMLPRGGGTSLAGQGVSRAVIIDSGAYCRALLSIDDDADACDVEPGLTIDDLNDELRRRGIERFFAPDPSTAKQCAIGGAIGNNAAGTRSIKYGRTSESILGLDVALADGHVVRLDDQPSDDPRVNELRTGVAGLCRDHAQLIRERFPKTLRRNAGYALDIILAQIDAGVPDDRLNLAPLLCGSEGTLGFVTRARLKLHETPKAKGLAVVGFSDLDAAIEAVPRLLELGPSAVELLDDLVIGLARTNLEYTRYVERMPAPTDGGELKAVLYVEFFEPSAEALENKIARVHDTARALPAGAKVLVLEDGPQMAGALKLRKAGEPLLHAIPGSRKPLGFIEDNAVPVENLGEFVRELRAIIEREGTRGAFYAHASVGVLHVRPLLDLRSDADTAAMERIAVETADLAQRLGGVMSGEHGDGKARGPLLERLYGPELMHAFRQLKALFDPSGLLNPGNIVRPGTIASIHESTRVRPRDRNLSYPNVDTFFDYTAEHGFDHAVEMCNGAGVCRKTHSGTMCPSYMGTLDERHSTRGRGNALRLAISGQLNDDGTDPKWNDEGTLDTLRLCLSCKACKTECPSNVDVAQYKAEYLAQSYRDAGRTPLAARVFGHVRTLNKLGSAFAPLSNWVANAKPNRFIADRVLGLAKQRTLPAFDRSLFAQLRKAAWYNRDLPTDAPRVLLYADCFTTYNDPRIGVAAAKLLNACGLRVEVIDAGCCGRAAISTGLLDEARVWSERGSRILDDALNADDHTLGVVACEPSCLSAMKDEWRKFARTPKDGRERAERVAQRAWMVEDFVHKHWDELPRTPRFAQPPGRVVVHGHCHQKALWGAETSAHLLERAFPDRVTVLDTGCCGMAGSFGYTADRYDLSMTIGELALFPAARELDADDALVAPGTSCRHQVHDGTKRHALHPVELLAQRLD